MVDCYKDNIMQENGHYDILLGNSFLDRLDKYKITKEGLEIYSEDMYFPRKTKTKEITFLTMVSKITIFKSFLLKELKDTKTSIKGVIGNKEDITKKKKRKCRNNDP